MRKIIFLLLVLIAAIGYGQTPTGTKTRFPGVWWQSKDTASATSADSIVVLANRGNQSLYWRWANSGAWSKIATYVGSGFLPISDTADMLSGYVRKYDGYYFIQNTTGRDYRQTARITMTGTINTLDSLIAATSTISGIGRMGQLWAGGSANWPTSTSANSAGRHIMNGDNGVGSQNGLIIWNENLDTSSKSFLWLSTKTALGATTQGGAELRGGIENTSDGSGFLEIRTTNSSGASKERAYVGSNGALQWGSRNYPSASVGLNQGRMFLTGSSTPAYVAWNEATPAANNEAALVMGAKTGLGLTTLAGAKIYGGLYNVYTGAGYARISTTTTVSGELPALLIDSSQNTTSYGVISYVNNKGGLLGTNSVTPKSYVDSLVALRLRISDTASMLSNRLKISDTANMMSGYGRTGQIVKYSDTAAMLSNRLKISDTSNMLSNYLRTTTASGTYLPLSGGTMTGILNSGYKYVTSATGTVYEATGASTSSRYMRVTNTSGDLLMGVDNSSGGNIIIGSAAYSGNIQALNGLNFSGNGGSNLHFGISSTGDASFSSSISAKKIIGNSSAPTIAAGTGAGTGPTISITGTDMAGEVNLTTGSAPSTGATVFTVTFNSSYSSAPYVVFQAANSATPGYTTQLYAGSSTTTFTMTSQNLTALPAGISFRWFYHVIQ